MVATDEFVNETGVCHIRVGTPVRVYFIKAEHFTQCSQEAGVLDHIRPGQRAVDVKYRKFHRLT